MQGMISIEDNSKAAVGLLGKLLQLSYIEQCILLDHIEEGMTFEDLVASLKSSDSHEAKVHSQAHRGALPRARRFQ